MAVKKEVVFWVVLCSMVVGYHCYRGPCCFPSSGL